MSFNQLTENLPDYAKDIRLNVQNLLNNISQSGLTEAQFYGTALAVAYSLKNNEIIEAVRAQNGEMDWETLNFAAKTAATLMYMNNIYYRTVHLAENKELSSLPANLRMNGLNNTGVPKVDFELSALAVSAINGCGMCIQSHVRQLVEHGVSTTAIQSTLRIAATLNALGMAMYASVN